MIKQLLDIADKYEITPIKEKLLEIQKPLKIKIGFLGEFNSGKSSLINAILGKKILPAMEKPTTKNIITLIPERKQSDIKFYKEENGELREIEPIEFQEIALGRKEGKTVIKIPPSKFLPEGIEIVDTPGIASLDKTDLEITLGLLPELDAAIICQDITFGTLPNSVLNFLRRVEVKPLLGKTLFVLTKADRIRPEEIPQAKAHAEEVIQNLFSEIGVKESAKGRVFVTSAEEALNGDREGIKEFLDGLNEKILNQKKKLEEERRKKEAIKIAEELISALKIIRDREDFNSEQLDNEIFTIERELKEILDEKRKLQKKIEEIYHATLKVANRILRAYKESIISADSEEAIEQIILQMEKEFSQEISELIDRKLKVSKEANYLVKEATDLIKVQIKDQLKKIEIIKTILTGLLTAVLIPSSGAAGAKNLGEFFLGAAARNLGKTGILGKIGKALSEVLKFINPVDLIADPIARKYLSQRYDELAAQTSVLIGKNIKEELETTLQEVFEELEEKAKVKETALFQLKNQKLKSLEEFNNYKDEVIRDIEKTEVLIKGGQSV